MAFSDNAFASNGNNNNINSTLWARNEGIAAAGSGLFDLDFVKGELVLSDEQGTELTRVAEARIQAYYTCVQTNPSCSWLVVGQYLHFSRFALPTDVQSQDPVLRPSSSLSLLLSSLMYLVAGRRVLRLPRSFSLFLLFTTAKFAAHTMPSTSTDGTQEPATAAVVRAFSGIKTNANRSYSTIPERVPAGSTGPWYRRATPLTVRPSRAARRCVADSPRRRSRLSKPLSMPTSLTRLRLASTRMAAS